MNPLFKLGKLPKRTDPRTFKLARYLVPENLPVPPSAIDWSAADTGGFPMFLNDEIGDCAIAGPAHMVEVWTANAAQEQTLTDADVLKAYKEVSGYVAGDPSTDNGCVMLDVMKYWRQTGIGGHKILAFVEVDPQNAFEVQCGLWLFGGLATGFALPNSVKEQALVWDVLRDDGGDWGGHMVNILASNADEKECVTWAKKQRMTNPFFTRYCDELYVVLSLDWIGKAGLSPSGFDMVRLQKDLGALKRK